LFFFFENINIIINLTDLFFLLSTVSFFIKIDLFVFVDKNLGNLAQPRGPLFFRIEENLGRWLYLTDLFLLSLVTFFYYYENVMTTSLSSITIPQRNPEY
jgi:hypothetical protein